MIRLLLRALTGLLSPAIERRGMNVKGSMGAWAVEQGAQREDATAQGRRERSAWLPAAPGPNVMLNRVDGVRGLLRTPHGWRGRLAAGRAQNWAQRPEGHDSAGRS